MELELRGVPTVTLISTPFILMAGSQSKALGMPSLRTLVLPHPIGGTPWESVQAKVDAALDELVRKMTEPIRTEAERPRSRLSVPESVEVGSTLEEVNALFMERGWGDGLPIVPPTEERVAAMLRATDHDPDHVVGAVPPKMRPATVQKIAVNAVMAGCQPRHLPLLIAAVQAMVETRFNLYALQTTTHCCAPLLIVNGPLRQALGIHGGNNAFGPGPWWNGAVGRASRFVLLNLGGGIPGEGDRATMGQPGKYTFCIAENEEASPWSSLARERGFLEGVSTVTVVGGEAPHNINDHESVTANGILRSVAGTMAQTGQNNVYYEGEPLVIFGPEHAATVAAEGFTKEDVRAFLFDEARLPLHRFSQENIVQRFQRKFPKRYANMSDQTLVPVAARAGDIMVMVAGGPGKHSMYVPTFGATLSVTIPIAHANGDPYTPADFA